jgi:hypothetical protein
MMIGSCVPYRSVISSSVSFTNNANAFNGAGRGDALVKCSAKPLRQKGIFKRNEICTRMLLKSLQQSTSDPDRTLSPFSRADEKNPPCFKRNAPHTHACTHMNERHTVGIYETRGARTSSSKFALEKVDHTLPRINPNQASLGISNA